MLTGHRGLLSFESDGANLGYEMTLLGRNELAPGESSEVEMWLWGLPMDEAQQREGESFAVLEGVRPVGNGKVLGPIRPRR